MEKQYGQKKGEDVYYGWLNKHGYQDDKPMKGQKSKAGAEAEAILDLFDAQTEPFQQEDHGQPPTLGQPGDIPGIVPQPTPTGDPTKPQGLGEADTDRPVTIAPGANDTTLPKTAYGPVPEHATGPYEPNADKPMQETAKEVPLNDQMNRRDQEIPAQAMALNAAQFVSVPAYHMEYVAAPKFEGADAPLLIKSIVLEEGHNVNNWRVVPEEFQKVADQYKAGRQLRVNHDKTVQSVIGKSYDGKVIRGSDIRQYLGRDIAGTDPEGQYVVAEFEANPKDPQIRQNILAGYVVTGSIGVDAEAYCEQCDTQLKAGPDGQMVRQCAHHDAPVKLRNVEVKEYSYVAEPAFEHTQAFPSFSAAMDSKLQAKEQTTKERNKLEEGEFAYPEERKLPINDAAHVRNALARFNQTDIPSGKKSEVLGRICRAAKKFGIESDLCKEKGKAEASGSSLLSTPPPTIQMSTTVEATAGKKPTKDDDGDMDGEAEARAAKLFADYKKAFAEGMKFRAKSEGEGEGKSEADASAEGKSEADAEGKSEADAESKSEAEASALPQKLKTDQISKSGRVAPKANKVSYLEQALHPTDSLMAAHPEMREIFKAAAEAPGAPEGARALRSRFA